MVTSTEIRKNPRKPKSEQNNLVDMTKETD